MIKIAVSAVMGAAIGAYAVSGPILKASHQNESVQSVSIDPLELTRRAKDLPTLEVKEPF